MAFQYPRKMILVVARWIKGEKQEIRRTELVVEKRGRWLFAEGYTFDPSSFLETASSHRGSWYSHQLEEIPSVAVPTEDVLASLPR